LPALCAATAASPKYGLWGGENEEQRVVAGFNLPAPVGIKRLDRASHASERQSA
jgi:hypothetical protein